MHYLKSFVPWIAFAVVATQFDWRYSGLVGFVLAGALVLWERREGRKLDTLIIELSAVGFFAALTVFSFAFPGSPLRPYAGALSVGWLAVTAWGSIFVGRPFTLGIARTMAPPEVWDNPFFKRVNVVITAAWAISFTVSAIAAATLLHFAPHATALLIAVKVAGFVLPAAFTVRYTRVVRARAQKAA
jgi:hypothetical protein